jgi:hypothetical protein
MLYSSRRCENKGQDTRYWRNYGRRGCANSIISQSRVHTWFPTLYFIFFLFFLLLSLGHNFSNLSRGKFRSIKISILLRYNFYCITKIPILIVPFVEFWPKHVLHNHDHSSWNIFISQFLHSLSPSPYPRQALICFL